MLSLVHAQQHTLTDASSVRSQRPVSSLSDVGERGCRLVNGHGRLRPGDFGSIAVGSVVSAPGGASWRTLDHLAPTERPSPPCWSVSLDTLSPPPTRCLSTAPRRPLSSSLRSRPVVDCQRDLGDLGGADRSSLGKRPALSQSQQPWNPPARTSALLPGSSWG